MRFETLSDSKCEQFIISFFGANITRFAIIPTSSSIQTALSLLRFLSSKNIWSLVVSNYRMSHLDELLFAINLSKSKYLSSSLELN